MKTSLNNSRFRISAFVFVAGLIFSASPSTYGQWDKKPYREWTQDNVQKILSESPWAQTYHPIVPTGSMGTISSKAVTMRLRSALTMRQALVRLRQLKAGYDKMNDRDKAAFDEKNKPLLDCPACADNYVVALSPGPGGQEGVPSWLKTMTLDMAKLDVHLVNERGERRDLVHYVPPRVTGDDAVFFFARFNDKGEPLIKPDSQKVVVMLGNRILLIGSIPKTSFIFDVSKMLVNGQVEF